MTLRTKAALRQQMKALRAELSPRAIAGAGEAAARHLAALPELATPQTVLVTLSVRRELPTGPTIAALYAMGHRLVVPEIIGDRMVARALDGPLIAGVHGIPTTAGDRIDEVHLVLCPGLAFDVSGGRLGFGKGYFDRFLLGQPNAVPIGLAYDGAIVDSVPVEAHDVRMRIVVTESEILRVAA